MNIGFLCPRMQQIHSTILEYFCSNTPVTFSTGPLLFLLLMMTGRVGGGGKEGEEGGLTHSELLHVTCDFPELSVIL